MNAALLNGNFRQSGTPNGAGWTTKGDVSFMADGATLGETGGREARLLQVFAVGANDKLLSGPGRRQRAAHRAASRRHQEAAPLPRRADRAHGSPGRGSELQRSGPGGALLADMLARCTPSEIAAYALFVDAKDEQASAFYQHHGFIPLPEAALTLFLPLAGLPAQV